LSEPTAEMTFNTAYLQFDATAQDDTQHLWHHMSKWSSDAWVGQTSRFCGDTV